MKGKKNAYICQTCGKYTITIDRENGTTPFMIGCQATPGCFGIAQSSFYRVANDKTPTHEWYKPQLSTLTDPWERDHVSKGGLLLREIATGKNVAC